MARLVLASASPRRRELLLDAGIECVVRPVDVDETVRPGEVPEQVVVRLSRAKADAVVATGAGPLVVAADTVAAVGAEVLAKPRDRADAARILRRLSGTRHRVLTGVTLVDVEADERETWIATTDVTMRRLAELEIEAYVATGEADGKAGAYAIQETGDRFVVGINGSFDTVVGLPVDVVQGWLRRRDRRG